MATITRLCFALLWGYYADFLKFIPFLIKSSCDFDELENTIILDKYEKHYFGFHFKF